jgi:hypothetical protein
MDWRVRRGLAPAAPVAESAAASAESAPIIALDEISRIVDGLDARFLGIKPKGWLPGRGDA